MRITTLSISTCDLTKYKTFRTSEKINNFLRITFTEKPSSVTSPNHQPITSSNQHTKSQRSSTKHTFVFTIMKARIVYDFTAESEHELSVRCTSLSRTTNLLVFTRTSLSFSLQFLVVLYLMMMMMLRTM